MDQSHNIEESKSSERGSSSSRGSVRHDRDRDRHDAALHTSAIDIHKAMKGDYVVKPQDLDRTRGGGSRTQSESRTAPTTGTSSLGSNNRRSTLDGTNSNNASGRRKSAGDEQQLQLGVRTRTTSGQRLTDMEILEQVTVLNLDTGERVPLSVAEHKLPQCINPLSLHIMRLTSEYIAREHEDEHIREYYKLNGGKDTHDEETTSPEGLKNFVPKIAVQLVN